MTGSVKSRLTPKELAKIHRGIRELLLAKGFKPVKKTDIDRALEWQSVQDLVNQGDSVTLTDDIASVASHYLTRSLRRRAKTSLASPPSVPLEPRPKGRELDSRHAISYALALAAYENPKARKQIFECRQLYWQEIEPPFNWVRSLKERRKESLAQAMEWLEEHASDHAQVAPLKLSVMIESSDTEKLKKAIMDLANAELNHPENAKQTLINIVNLICNSDTQIANWLQDIGGYLPKIDIEYVDQKHGGHFIEIKNQKIAVSKSSYLWKMYSYSRSLGKELGWPIERVLVFLFTNEPPSLGSFFINQLPSRRTPKAISFDHMALLQLVYHMPNEAWSTRLRQWDKWLKDYPEEGFRLFFQSPEPDRIASDTQRAKWMATEFRRAKARASAFFPMLNWIE